MSLLDHSYSKVKGYQCSRCLVENFLIFQDTFSYYSKAWSSRSSVPPKNGVTGLDHLETVLPTYWSTSFAVPLIPESDMAEEDQDMKMHEEKELCRG